MTWSGLLGVRTLWNPELAWQLDGGAPASQPLRVRAIDRETLAVEARVPVVSNHGTATTVESRNAASIALSGPTGANVMGTPLDSGVTHVAQAQLDGGVDFSCQLEAVETVPPLFLRGCLVTGRANHLSVYLRPGVDARDSGWVSSHGSPRGDWAPVETP